MKNSVSIYQNKNKEKRVLEKMGLSLPGSYLFIDIEVEPP